MEVPNILDKNSNIDNKNNFLSNPLNIFPLKLFQLNEIKKLKSQLSSITFENQGKKLLSKKLFNSEDKKIYKLLLIKNCIPPEYRGEFWFISSGAKFEMSMHKNYYKYLLEKYPKHLQFNSIAICKDQIEKDVPRTFGTKEISSKNKKEILEKMEHILLCYNRRNLSVRYVQGFNFIVGRILQFIPDEEKAFWLFVQIIEDILPCDFFPGEMIGLMADVNLLVCIIKEFYCKNIFTNLQNIEGANWLENIFIQWFVSLFLLKFPRTFMNVIWDLLFIEKRIVLYKTCIIITKKFCKDLESIKSIEHFLSVMKSIENFNDENYFKYNLLIKKFEFDDHFIEYNRAKLLDEMKIKVKNHHQKKINSVKEGLQKRQDYCNINWPMCIYDPYFKYQSHEALIFQVEEEPIIYEDYFNINKLNIYKTNKINKIISFDSPSELNFKDLLIERKEHFCNIYGKDLKQEIKSENNELDKSYSSEKEEIINDIKPKENYKQLREGYKNLRKIGKAMNSYAYIKQRKLSNNGTLIRKPSRIEDFMSKATKKYERYRVPNFETVHNINVKIKEFL